MPSHGWPACEPDDPEEALARQVLPTRPGNICRIQPLLHEPEPLHVRRERLRLPRLPAQVVMQAWRLSMGGVSASIIHRTAEFECPEAAGSRSSCVIRWLTPRASGRHSCRKSSSG